MENMPERMHSIGGYVNTLKLVTVMNNRRNPQTFDAGAVFALHTLP